MDGGETSNEPDEAPRSVRRDAREYLLVVAVGVAFAMIVRTFLFQAFSIPSESMESTLVVGDHLVAYKVGYWIHDVRRGDVVVFERPEDLSDDRFDHLVKRVIAVAGDTVQGLNGVVLVNGQETVEPYLGEGVEAAQSEFGPLTVGAGELFVMGDNRGQSYDSRFFGPIESNSVVGRAVFTYWPLDRLGAIGG